MSKSKAHYAKLKKSRARSRIDTKRMQTCPEEHFGKTVAIKSRKMTPLEYFEVFGKPMPRSLRR